MPKQDAVRYEFESRPEGGETMPVIDGVVWLRMPLPFVLGHINLWLLQDGDGWSIVDTGVDTEESEAVWERTLSDTMAGRGVRRIIATHLHPDHSGMIGWLSRKTGSALWMTRDEYLLCRVLVSDTGRPAPPEGIEFYRAAGFDDEALQRYIKMFGMFGKFVSPLPESYHRIHDGDELKIGEHTWRVLVGRGHSPEHACLYCEVLNVVISGDQLLPTISSNVSVFPTEPDADPLKAWMESLANLKDRLPEDVLVLPAHGKPFRGAHDRLDALIHEHEEGLSKLLDLCSTPRRVVDVFPALFKREIDARNRIMATGEATAHLNCLLHAGGLQVETDADGVRWYRRA